MARKYRDYVYVAFFFGGGCLVVRTHTQILTDDGSNLGARTTRPRHTKTTNDYNVVSPADHRVLPGVFA